MTGKTLDKSVVKPESLQAMAKVCVPTAGAPGVACWFPMTLLAMSLMSQQACKSKPRKKIAKVRRPPVHQPPSSVLSSSPEIPLRLLDLRAEEDPVKQAFWEACHRSLDYFASLDAIPRTPSLDLIPVKVPVKVPPSATAVSRFGICLLVWCIPKALFL